MSEDSEKFDYSQPHKLINGEPILLTEDEIAEQTVVADTWAAGQAKREALAQIAALETQQTARLHREAIIGAIDIKTAAIKKLADINIQISQLRAKLT